jgi:integrase
MMYRAAATSTRFLDTVEDYWKDAPIRSITPGAVRQAAIALYPHASGATRNRQVIVPTQAVVNQAASLEKCRPLKVERFAVVKREKEPATWEWVQAFMAHANPHLGALACFMFLTGARITEALSLTWADTSLTDRRALIRQTKIGSERRAHLPPPLVAAIANIPSNRDPDGVPLLVQGYRCPAMGQGHQASRHQGAILPRLPAWLCDSDASSRRRSDHGGEARRVEIACACVLDLWTRNERRHGC